MSSEVLIEAHVNPLPSIRNWWWLQNGYFQANTFIKIISLLNTIVNIFKSDQNGISSTIGKLSEQEKKYIELS